MPRARRPVPPRPRPHGGRRERAAPRKQQAARAGSAIAARATAAGAPAAGAAAAAFASAGVFGSERRRAAPLGAAARTGDVAALAPLLDRRPHRRRAR